MFFPSRFIFIQKFSGICRNCEKDELVTLTKQAWDKIYNDEK